MSDSTIAVREEEFKKSIHYYNESIQICDNISDYIVEYILINNIHNSYNGRYILSIDIIKSRFSILIQEYQAEFGINDLEFYQYIFRSVEHRVFYQSFSYFINLDQGDNFYTNGRRIHFDNKKNPIGYRVGNKVFNTVFERFELDEEKYNKYYKIPR